MNNDIIVSISTSLGKGAISIVRLSGDGCIQLVNKCFKGKDLTTVDSHTINFGYILDKDEVIEYGDVVCIGCDGLVHKYDSLQYDITTVIGVCSDSIGLMLGGEGIPEDEQVEVELVGQIWVKTNDLNIIPGTLVAVDIDGTVRKTNSPANRL